MLHFLRYLRSSKHNGIMNMLSLVPGLTCCLLILMWLVPEVQTDHCFPKLDRIVMVCGQHTGQAPFVGAPPALAPHAKQECPEVELATRITYAGNTVSLESNSTVPMVSFFSDADVFGIFDLKLINGHFYTDNENDKCNISKSAAMQLFGSVNVVDSLIITDNGRYYVCGVFEDLPHNTTVMANMVFNAADLYTSGLRVLLPMSSSEYKTYNDVWYNNSFMTYVLLRKAEQIDSFGKKIHGRAGDNIKDFYLSVFPLKDKYLHSEGTLQRIILMLIIALVVLFIACINFINMATASFSTTAIKTGIHKILGASRQMLICRYLFNTFLLVLLSLILSISLSWLVLPLFCQIIDNVVLFSALLNPTVILLMVSIVFVTTFLAGLYPAIFLSSFQPISVLKGRGVIVGEQKLRYVLVGLQFGASLILVVCCLVIVLQIHRFNNLDLGYDYEKIVNIDTKNKTQYSKKDVLINELLQDSHISAVSRSLSSPASCPWNGVGFDWDGRDPNFEPLVYFNYCDENFLSVYNMKLAEGRFFTKGSDEVVINQEFAHLIGDSAILGRRLVVDNMQRTIVGVLGDCRLMNYNQANRPYILCQYPDWLVYPVDILSVRGTSDCSASQLYNIVYAKSKEIFGEEPSICFVDSQLQRYVHNECQLAKMMTFFSILAIFISCVGLFGVATFMIERCRKEIGVRRVNGASVSEIIKMLLIWFVNPIMVGYIIACPIAYFLMKHWLMSYPDRIHLSWWIFVVSGIFMCIVAVLILIWRIYKAAVSNPIDSLKSE